MSSLPKDKSLHLPSLSIMGFRGILSLSLPRLGRVTLIAGRNGVGKTTILDAVRVFAARGNYYSLRNMLMNREETTIIVDSDGAAEFAPDLNALFYGRLPSQSTSISIGDSDPIRRLNIRAGMGLMHQGPLFVQAHPDPYDVLLTVEYANNKQDISVMHLTNTYSLHPSPRRPSSSQSISEIPCESVGPSLMVSGSVSRFWDSVALTDYENQYVEALNLIYGTQIERVVMVGEGEGPNERPRKALVKVTGLKMPVPLKSLGDGAVRMFGTALTLSTVHDGFLLIDEAENGLHYSVQSDFWKLVMQIARQNNVQIFATTHSWDCIVGFEKALRELGDVDGSLYRIDRIGDSIEAVDYDSDDIRILVQQGIESR